MQTDRTAMSFGSGAGSVFTTVIKFMYPNTKPRTALLQFGGSQYRIASAPIKKKLPGDHSFMKDNFKNRNHEKERFKRRNRIPFGRVLRY